MRAHRPTSFGPEKGIGHFEHNAARIFVGEEIPARELELVEGAQYVEEEGIAAPTGKEPVVASLRHMSFVPCRDRHPLDDHPPARACFSRLCALSKTQRRALLATFKRREAHLVADIGDGIAVRIDLQLVPGLGREGLGSSRSRRIEADGRMHVHDEDRLAGVSWLGKGIQIGQVEARVPARESDIGTGVMV